jgi:hypothetical protein
MLRMVKLLGDKRCDASLAAPRTSPCSTSSQVHGDETGAPGLARTVYAAGEGGAVIVATGIDEDSAAPIHFEKFAREILRNTRHQ